MVTETCIMVLEEEPYSKMDCLTNMKFTAKYIKRLIRDQNLEELAIRSGMIHNVYSLYSYSLGLLFP